MTGDDCQGQSNIRREFPIILRDDLAAIVGHRALEGVALGLIVFLAPPWRSGTPEVRNGRYDANGAANRWTAEQKQPELQMLLTQNSTPSHSISLPVDISSSIAYEAEKVPTERAASITGGCLSPLAFTSPDGLASPSRWTTANFTPMSSGPTRVQPLPVDYQRSAVCSAPSSPLTQSRPPPVNDGSLRAPNYDGGSRGSAQQKRNFFETL
uniref:Uncharacterized protein n=1 Tax=Plectus sambesii TaxID=2011161 RepID=A0A914V3Y9_9BILA